MATKRRGTIHERQASYLSAEIALGSLERKRRALQMICKFYRNGSVFRTDDRGLIENTILGILNSSSSDEKVRRWALAALTHVGNPQVSRTAVFRALLDYPDEPQVLSAAIANLFKFDGHAAYDLITSKAICSPEIIALSALQTIDPRKVDLSKVNINFENSEPTLLKLGLVAIGLERAPEFLFHPKYSNSSVVKLLGAHDEPLVSQYSVWAAAENSKLGAKDIGIDFKDLERQPPNIRSYVYRLMAEEPDESTLRTELIECGSKDREVEARIGLSIGLRDIYFDSLPNLTDNWFHDEHDDDVQSYLLDHFAVNSHKSLRYKEICIDHYREARNNEKKRFRLAAAAGGTALYTELRQIDIKEESGFLDANRSTYNVTNNSFVNNGKMVGAFSQAGDVSSSDNISITEYNYNNVLQILEDVSRETHEMPVSQSARAELDHAVQVAKSNPNKDSIGKVVSTLQKIENGFNAVDGMVQHAKNITPLILSLGAYFS
ncbi:hypothetical protein [Ochrobactrum sp. BTU1]|jgi:hypothetical protein|uniref:hypothetical protein n=1 Tax=Ochrobactrum sp. BTU1 TaxID=2840456 RepID=UPI001C03E9F1|nr:hypothetical protein KMS41_18330 [Ochrobactrum sp. BTU1]